MNFVFILQHLRNQIKIRILFGLFCEFSIINLGSNQLDQDGLNFQRKPSIVAPE